MNSRAVAMRLVMVPLATVAAALAVAAPVAKPAPVSAPASGRAVFAKWCGDCHTRPSGPGTMSLQRKYDGSIPAVLEQRTDLTPEYVSLMVRKGISFMPSFRKTEITDAELAQLGAYLANPKGRKRPKQQRP